MKKNVLILLLAAALTLGACGQSGSSEASEASSVAESTAESEAQESEAEAEEPAEVQTEEYVDDDATPIVDKTIEEEGIDAFVTIGEYKGLKLTKTITPVTDEDVESRITADLEMYPAPVEDDDAILMPGSIANIDFVGDINGEVFEGGTGDDYNLEIGSGSFIEGFEDQLLEHKKGDVVDVNVTFPEDYYEELAGKDAHFSVTINEIREKLTEPTDEWCAANTEYKTVAEYREGIRETLQKEYDEDSDYTLHSEAWDMVADTAEFYQYPKQYIDDFTAIIKSNYEYYAESYGMGLDEMLAMYGMTEENLSSEAKPDVRQCLIAACILAKENIPLDGKEMEDTVAEILHQNELGSVEEAESLYGISATQLHYIAMRRLAENKLVEHAEVEEVQAEEDPVEDTEEIVEEDHGEIVGYAEDGEPIDKVEGDAN